MALQLGEMGTQTMAGMKGQLRSGNVRDRHASWSAVARLAENHPDFVTAEALAHALLPDFLAALSDPCPREAVRGKEAFQQFGQAVERENLAPFVQPRTERLGQKLRSNQLSAQRHVDTCTSEIAEQVEDGFAPCGGQLGPIIKWLVVAVLHTTQGRTWLGKAFECVLLLAKAADPAGSRMGAEGIMREMTQAAQVPGRPSNDPVAESMLRAAQRICWTMQADALPVTPRILRGILAKFTHAPKELDQNTRDAIGDDEEVSLALSTDKDVKINMMVMRIPEMEASQNVLECVPTFVAEPGKLCAPSVAQTAQVLLPA